MDPGNERSRRSPTPHRRRVHSLLLRLPAAAVLLAATAAAAADPACTVLRPRAPVLAATLGVVAGPELPEQVLEAAIGRWSGCSNYGTGFPALAAGADGDRTVTVLYDPRETGDGRCGSFAGREIRLYARTELADGRVVGCGSLELNLAHEIGHVLGLVDAPPGRACGTRVMAHIDPSDAFSRRVTAEECQVVGQRWLTPAEMSAVPRDRRTRITGLVAVAGR